MRSYVFRWPCIERSGSEGLCQDVEERASMGLCDILFSVLSYRFYGHQLWSRKRYGSRQEEHNRMI